MKPELCNTPAFGKNGRLAVIMAICCLLTLPATAQWVQKNNGLSGADVMSLAINPSGHIFAGTNQKGIYRSTDNGASWTSVNSGHSNLNVAALVAKGTDLFSGSYSGMHRSSDNGNSWVTINSGLNANQIRCFVVKEGTKLFAGSDSDGVFFSANNGDSWVPVNTGLTNDQVHSLAVIGTNLFAATDGGVFLSMNDGASWAAVNTGLTDLTVLSLTATGSNLFAGTGGDGVFISSNNGSSWSAVNTGLTNSTVLSLMSNGPDVFAGTVDGVYFTDDNGASWTQVNTGLTIETAVNVLAMNTGNIFAGVTGVGIYRSSNNGASWSVATIGMESPKARALVSKGTNLFAGAESGVFVSADNGTTWAAVNSGLTSLYVNDLAADGNNLFAATTKGGVFLSSNNGVSWAPVNTGLTSPNVRALLIHQSKLFAATSVGVYASSDNGTSWFPSNTGITNNFIEDMTSVGTSVFAATQGGGVFRSTNNGATWTSVNTNLTSLSVYSLAAIGSDLYAGAANSGTPGVFKSSDNGSSWSVTGLSNVTVTSLGVNGDKLFAGVDGIGGGVYFSRNHGDIWSMASEGFTPGNPINSFAVHNGNLFAARDYQGVWARPLTDFSITLHVSATSGNDTNNGSSAAPLRNIQTALVQGGDTIKVAAGTYQEGLITQSSVVLLGGYTTDFTEANRDIFVNRTTLLAESATLFTDTHGCTIDGFVFDGNSTAETILHSSSASTITHNIFVRAGFASRALDITGNGRVINNTIHDNDYGVYVSGAPTSTAIIKNNIISSSDFGFGNSTGVQVNKYNDLYLNSFDYIGGAAQGTGEINLNPLFLDPENGDFRLSAASPAIDRGDPSDPVGDEPEANVLRIDMGAYGGTKNATTAVVQPTSQTSALSLSASASSVTVNYTIGTGSSRLLVCRAGSDINSHPVDGVTYIPNNAFGSAPEIGFGNFVVGISTNSDPIVVTGLSPSTLYFFRMYEFNGSSGSENYLPSTAANNPRSTTTTGLASQPSSQTFFLTFSSVSSSSITVGYTIGTGSSRILIAKQGNLVDAIPQDGNTYVPDNKFGDGDEIGTGNFVVGVSTDTSPVTVTGLSSGTTYFFQMFEFNGSGGLENYNPNSASNNPRSTATTISVAEPTLQPTGLIFSGITTNGLSGSFTQAGAAGYLVLMGPNAVPNTPPTDGQTYTLNQSLGNATVKAIGSSTNFNVTGLVASTQYYFQIFSFNGTGTSSNYLVTLPLQRVISTAPSVNTSNFSITGSGTNSLNISWTNGNGSKRLIVAREGSAVNQVPVNGVSYIASSSFSSGDDLSGGNYVIYNGSGNSMTVIDLAEGEDYYFKAFEYNDTGMETYIVSGSAFSTDTSPPVVTHPSSPSVEQGQAATVSVTITDDGSPIASANVQFRSISVGGDLVTRALNGSGSTYSAQIQPSEIGELGIEYKVTATSGGGSYTDPTYKIKKVSIPVGSGPVIPYSSFGSKVNSYRIISIPLELDSKSVGSVFNELAPADPEKWRIYHYENGSNKELTSNSLIETGKGYWLIVKNDPGEPIISGSGTTVQTSSENPFTINLTAGWNQIGNPYNFKISWDDMQTANPGLPDIRTFDGDFTDDDRLNVMEGGFVNVTTARTLVFPVVKNTSLGREKNVKKQWQNPIDQNNWQVYITLSQDERTNRISGFGMHENASESRDEFDGLTMPRFFGEHLEINHHKKSGNDHFSKDIVPTTENYTWEFDIDTNLEGKVITFSWDNSYFGDNEKSLVLWDAAQQIGIDMRTSNSYTFEKDKSRTFRVFFGSAEEVKERSMASRFVFHSVSPNPADGDVVISFSVPKDADQNMVEAEIYDLMGRKTWHHQAQFGAGYQQLVWRIEGQDAHGIYIIQLKQGSATEQKRIIIKSN